jgi:hypothetical protein
VSIRSASGSSAAVAGSEQPGAHSARPDRVERGARANTGLRVIDREAYRRESQRRRARIVYLICGCALGGALAVVAVAQALVGAQQVRLDVLRSEVGTAVTSAQSLALTRAELDAPGRVIEIAEQQLHMVDPSTVTYLRAVAPGPSVFQIQSESNQAVRPRTALPGRPAHPRQSESRPGLTHTAGRARGRPGQATAVKRRGGSAS